MLLHLVIDSMDDLNSFCDGLLLFLFDVVEEMIVGVGDVIIGIGTGDDACTVLVVTATHDDGRAGSSIVVLILLLTL